MLALARQSTLYLSQSAASGLRDAMSAIIIQIRKGKEQITQDDYFIGAEIKRVMWHSVKSLVKLCGKKYVIMYLMTLSEKVASEL